MAGNFPVMMPARIGMAIFTIMVSVIIIWKRRFEGFLLPASACYSLVAGSRAVEFGWRCYWKDDIYLIWEIAPPFNTIENHTWLNVTGTLPYMEALSNGGTRCDIAARDLYVRAKYLSVDNMHERNKQICSCFASPVSVNRRTDFCGTPGAAVWCISGPPWIDRADIEGFWEIFPQNGVLASFQPKAYLGMELSAQGIVVTSSSQRIGGNEVGRTWLSRCGF